MIRSIVFACMILLAANTAAQPKGYTPVKNLPAFRQSLGSANAGKKTITSDFSQTKNLSLLSDKIKSKGKFFFMKEDKVRIEYTSPFTYLMVMNSGHIMVKDEQKTNRINTKNSKTMQSVNRVMIDCMRGTVFQNPDFRVHVFESSSGYLLSLQPVNESMKKMFRQIDVYMDRTNFDVSKLSMMETGGDHTEMDFTNTKHNVALNESLFKVK